MYGSESWCEGELLLGLSDAMQGPNACPSGSPHCGKRRKEVTYNESLVLLLSCQFWLSRFLVFPVWMSRKENGHGHKI